MPSQPCSNCRSTVNGRLKYFYLATYDGEKQQQWRLRMCSVCQESLIMDLISIGDVKLPTGWAAPEAAL